MAKKGFYHRLVNGHSGTNAEHEGATLTDEQLHVVEHTLTVQNFGEDPSHFCIDSQSLRSWFIESSNLGLCR